MKYLILSLLLASSTAFAYSDKDVGYCGAYHLLQKHYDNVADIVKKANNQSTMQMYAREFITLVEKDAVNAIKVGRASCKAIDYAQN